MPLLRAPVALAAATLVLAACTARPAAEPVRLAPAVTLSPHPLPAPPARRLPAPVAEGTVLRVAGPSDDRYALTRARLRDGSVDAALLLSVEVGEDVVLEAVAHFYDAAGALLGSTRQLHAHRGDLDVAVELAAAPAYRSEVASAALHVPVLVAG